MNILLTALSLVALCGCFLAYTRTLRAQDATDETETRVNVTAMKLRDERARVTVCERELDALRRELRKLSGKFYASQRENDDDEPRYDERLKDLAEARATAHQFAAAWDRAQDAAPCENWLTAQREGPHSKAATCECLYCMTQRADRARARRELVPKGAQAVATTAKLNSGQP